MSRKVLLSIIILAVLAISGTVMAADAAVEQACREYIDSMSPSWDTVNSTNLYKNLANYVVVDVRTEQEYAAGHIEGAINVSLREMMDNLDRIPKDKQIVVHCKSGIRSSYALAVLKMLGWEKVDNLLGGFNDWVAKDYPVVK